MVFFDRQQFFRYVVENVNKLDIPEAKKGKMNEETMIWFQKNIVKLMEVFCRYSLDQNPSSTTFSSLGFIPLTILCLILETENLIKARASLGYHHDSDLEIINFRQA